jgi:enterochelin esterase family protein
VIIVLILGAGYLVWSVFGHRMPVGEVTMFEQLRKSVEDAPPEKQASRLKTLLPGDLEAPLVQGNEVVFLYSGSGDATPRLVGDFNGWPDEGLPMKRLGHTDLYYLKKTFERDARFDYKINAGGDWILDPLNPNSSPSGFGVNSELAMPGFEPSPWLERRPDIQHGTLESMEFTSRRLDNTRKVQLYLPPGYDSKLERRYPTLYVHDGSDYLEHGKMANALDNLIASGKIEPLIVVFVDPVERRREYGTNDRYVAFLEKELVPWVDGHLRTLQGPEKRGVMGASMGGLISLYSAFNHPDVFRLVGLQSAALLNDTSRILEAMEKAPAKPLRIYTDIGSYERWDIFESYPEDHMQFHKILREKGYDYKWIEVPQGHAWGSWRNRLDELLVFLYPSGGAV